MRFSWCPQCGKRPGAADQTRRLFLVPNTHVIKLNTSGGTVTGIQASFNGVQKTLVAPASTAVVLALGTIESTRLRGSTRSRGRPTRHKKVMGRNLMVHVRDNVQATIKSASGGCRGGSPWEPLVAAAAFGARFNGPREVPSPGDRVGRSRFQPPDERLLFSMIPDVDEVDGPWVPRRAGQHLDLVQGRACVRSPRAIQRHPCPLPA